MINCIIIDDEEYSIATLSAYIHKTDDLELIATYSNPSIALSEIKAGVKADLVFLDIDMPELNGFEVADLLPPGIAIIYITAFADYALKAFETNVYDFLLKPISFARFLKSANKMKDIMGRYQPAIAYQPTIKANREAFFFINPGVKGKVIKIAFTDIIYIEGLKNYVIIYMQGIKHITYLTMQEVELALPSNLFLRIHKSHIINVTKIQAIEGNTVILTNQISLSLGGNYKNNVMTFINSHALISKRTN